MMKMNTISSARLKANRRNARKSTGPKSDEGKARARLNAWVHGLRAAVDNSTPEELEQINRRKGEWSSAFPACSSYERWMVHQLVTFSVRIDRCQDKQRDQHEKDKHRADPDWWEAERVAEVEELGKRLASDPAAVAARLRTSRQGIDWLLDRWKLLEAAIENGHDWEETQFDHCLDLLGAPVETRPIDRAALEAMTEDDRHEMIQAEIAELETLRNGLADLFDEADRLLALQGRGDDSAELRRYRRYEEALWRHFQRVKDGWLDSRYGFAQEFWEPTDPLPPHRQGRAGGSRRASSPPEPLEFLPPEPLDVEPAEPDDPFNLDSDPPATIAEFVRRIQSVEAQPVDDPDPDPESEEAAAASTESGVGPELEPDDGVEPHPPLRPSMTAAEFFASRRHRWDELDELYGDPLADDVPEDVGSGRLEDDADAGAAIGDESVVEAEPELEPDAHAETVASAPSPEPEEAEPATQPNRRESDAPTASTAITNEPTCRNGREGRQVRSDRETDRPSTKPHLSQDVPSRSAASVDPSRSANPGERGPR